MKKRKICVFTGSRSEYGLLYWLMQNIKKDRNLKLQIIASGMHLSSEFGSTYKEIEKDGFKIDKKVNMRLSSENITGVAKSTGTGLIKFAKAMADLRPDVLIVLGDRFEALSVASAALFMQIPIAHIHGGEVTVGSIDDSIRHSISKMSWWHFVATKEYRKRVIQLGENPKRVFQVGGMGVDAIKKTKLINKENLQNKLGFKFGEKFFLVTFHPVTNERNNAGKQIKEILYALSELKNTKFIFTAPNADLYGNIIKKHVYNFVTTNSKKCFFFKSMGRINYLSVLQFVDGVIGNSSSGLSEAPSFKIGTINIGDRQKGRIKASSIIDCSPKKKSINSAIKKLYSRKFQQKLKSTKNPYGIGNASKKIFSIIKNKRLPKNLKKEFFDL